MIVAVDGPAASGKGTLARKLAEHLNFAYLDTGALYRAVGLAVLRAGADPGEPGAAREAARGLTPDRLASLTADSELRTDRVAAAASAVAADPGVREALLGFQRRFAAHPPGGKRGAVLDGRDIGTVVCPEAEVKIFLTANPETRAARRLEELRQRGVEAIHSRVLQEMRERDERDSQRAIAPLAPAADAFLLDTTALDADAVFAAALARIASVAAAIPVQPVRPPVAKS
jgi:cytidylate kinase